MAGPQDDDVIDAEDLGIGDATILPDIDGTAGDHSATLPHDIAGGEPFDAVLDDVAMAGGDTDPAPTGQADGVSGGSLGQEDRAPDDDHRLVLYDPLRRYLQEVKRFELLTPDEEHDLAIRYQKTGDVDAAYRLTTAHLRLVVRIAFDFKRTWLNLLDLIQEGNVGLLLAIRKFDPYRGIRLSTYAAWWIRAYIIKFLLDNWRLVKVGTTNARRRLLFNLRKEKDALLAQGIEPLPKLLAERLSVTEQDVIEVDRSLGMTDVSFEARTSPDSDQVVGETLASGEPGVDTLYEEKERRELLNRKLDEFATTLEPRDQTVFRERLLAEEPATLQELGIRFGLTREGLRQVEKRLLRRLKEFLTASAADLHVLEVARPSSTDKPQAAADRSAARTHAATPPLTPAKKVPSSIPQERAAKATVKRSASTAQVPHVRPSDSEHSSSHRLPSASRRPPSPPSAAVAPKPSRRKPAPPAAAGLKRTVAKPEPATPARADTRRDGHAAPRNPSQSRPAASAHKPRGSRG